MRLKSLKKIKLEFYFQLDTLLNTEVVRTKQSKPQRSISATNDCFLSVLKVTMRISHQLNNIFKCFSFHLEHLRNKLRNFM